jgi:hypothetical protein
MGRIKFRVPESKSILPETQSVTRTQIVELDLSARNELRFHLTPDQLFVYTAWKLSGTALSFNEWLNEQKWDDEAKKFIIPVI